MTSDGAFLEGNYPKEVSPGHGRQDSAFLNAENGFFGSLPAYVQARVGITGDDEGINIPTFGDHLS